MLTNRPSAAINETANQDLALARAIIGRVDRIVPPGSCRATMTGCWADYARARCNRQR